MCGDSGIGEELLVWYFKRAKTQRIWYCLWHWSFPIFLPWPQCGSCNSRCVLVVPFGWYFACKLIYCCCPKWYFAALCTFYNTTCRALAMVLLHMTFWLCYKTFDSALFFVLFSKVGDTSGSAFRFLGSWQFRSYDGLFLTCSAVLVIEPISSVFFLLPARFRY